MNTLIKWPGGKSREIKYIEKLIPEYDRYIEPFFGSGAMYFYLQPKKALINDISTYLTEFYTLVKSQNKEFCELLYVYDHTVRALISVCDDHYDEILQFYRALKNNSLSLKELKKKIAVFLGKEKDNLYSEDIGRIVTDYEEYQAQMVEMSVDKFARTVKNEAKTPFSEEDLKENLITGFMSGLYMYFRSVYNAILLGKMRDASTAYKISNFYFIREYCYGSMFRYNRNGEFNIPYGGMSYNRKDFKSKIDYLQSSEVSMLFKNTEIHCQDFLDFVREADLTEKDFMFLDPPYDTDFSDYEGKNFTKDDQHRLADTLKNTRAKFILIIKNTDFIYSLYRDHFNILSFDKTYTYNVRSRNDRNVEHLIITNLPV